jgi:hypothetical protein
MLWKCPACGSRVFEDRDGAARPQPGIVYRCYVCHLDVAYDPTLKKMRPSPVPPIRIHKKPRTA